MRMSRGLASLKSNQMPPLMAPFCVIWIGSQNLVLKSVLGSVSIQRPPVQPARQASGNVPGGGAAASYLGQIASDGRKSKRRQPGASP